MTVEIGAAQAGRRGSAQAPVAVQVICLVLAAYITIQNVGTLVWDWPFSPPFVGGTWGDQDLRSVRGGYFQVKRTEPGGPLDRAGVTAGDLVRFEPPSEIGRNIPAGETDDVTIIHDGHISRIKLTSAPRKTMLQGGSANWFEDLETALGALIDPSSCGAASEGGRRSR